MKASMTLFLRINVFSKNKKMNKKTFFRKREKLSIHTFYRWHLCPHCYHLFHFTNIKHVSSSLYNKLILEKNSINTLIFSSSLYSFISEAKIENAHFTSYRFSVRAADFRAFFLLASHFLPFCMFQKVAAEFFLTGLAA